MPKMTIQLTIGDYSKWRAGFDGGKSIRKAAGVSNEQVYRNADKPTEVMVVADAADVQKARQMLNSPELRAWMKENGVVGEPQPYFMQE